MVLSEVGGFTPFFDRGQPFGRGPLKPIDEPLPTKLGRDLAGGRARWYPNPATAARTLCTGRSPSRHAAMSNRCMPKSYSRQW